MSAKSDLEAMKSSLRGWLKYRSAVDMAVAAGKPGASAIRDAYRDPQVEFHMASELYGLLSQVVDPATLPSPSSESAAVALAKIVLEGKTVNPNAPTAQGLVPVAAVALVVLGFMTLTVFSAVKTISDNALERERIAACKVSPENCPVTLTTVLKWALVVGGGYLVYKYTVVGEKLTAKYGRKK